MEIREPAVLEITQGRRRTVLRWETREEGRELIAAVARKNALLDGQVLPGDADFTGAVIYCGSIAPYTGQDCELPDGHGAWHRNGDTTWHGDIAARIIDGGVEILGRDEPERPRGGHPYPEAPDCDAMEFGGGPPSMLDGKCRCLVCGRCGHHTGNSHQGHYWAWCKVTKTLREHHMCCPDPAFGCELEVASGGHPYPDEPVPYSPTPAGIAYADGFAGDPDAVRAVAESIANGAPLTVTGDGYPDVPGGDPERDLAEEAWNRAFCGVCGTSPCEWDGVPDGFHAGQAGPAAVAAQACSAFASPGLTEPDAPPPDECMVCGQPKDAHPAHLTTAPFDVAAGIDPFAIPANRIGTPAARESAPCERNGRHGPHGRCLGSLGTAEGTAPYPAQPGQARCHDEGGMCGAQYGHGGPDHIAYGDDGEPLHAWPVTYDTRMACGDTLADAAPYGEGAPMWCPRHGETTAITQAQWLELETVEHETYPAGTALPEGSGL